MLVTRKVVCERLRLKRRASYSIVPPTRGPMVSSSSVVELLNSCRSGGEDEVSCIPSDIITAEEAALISGVPADKLMRMTRSVRNRPPHFRINKQTTRFRRSSMEKWSA